MKIEIDMSGKIEQTQLDTVIGLSNNIQFSVILSKRAKRSLQLLFRKQNKIATFPYFIFAVCTAILLALANPKHRITIDREYEGHEGLIKSWIMVCMGKLHRKVPYIVFEHIGKSSPAHKLCSDVVSKKKKATKIIKVEDLIELLPLKKSGTLYKGRRST